MSTYNLLQFFDLSHSCQNRVEAFYYYANLFFSQQAKKDVEEKTEGCICIPGEDACKEDVIKACVENVIWQMDKDRKSTALKALQGHVWREGYNQEKLKAE